MSPHSSTPRARFATRLSEPVPAERVLVVRLGAVGDVVRTRIAFAGLRELYPRARIEWLVEDRASDALDGIVGLDSVLRVPRRELSALHGARSLRVLRDLVRELRELGHSPPVVLMTSFGGADTARRAKLEGAFGYLDKPFQPDELYRVVEQALRKQPAAEGW